MGFKNDRSIINWGWQNSPTETLQEFTEHPYTSFLSTHLNFGAVRADGNITISDISDSTPIYLAKTERFNNVNDVSLTDIINISGITDISQVIAASFTGLTFRRFNNNIFSIYSGVYLGVTEGHSIVMTQDLSNIKHVSPLGNAFSGIDNDGNLHSWGWRGQYSTGGGNNSDNVPEGTKITEIVGTLNSGAALTTEGSVVTWGSGGGIGSAANKKLYLTSGVIDVSNELLSDCIALYSSWRSFAALKNNGNIVIWGDLSGSNYYILDPSFSQFKDIINLYPCCQSGTYTGLKNDGTIVNMTADLSFVKDVIKIDTGFPPLAILNKDLGMNLLRFNNATFNNIGVSQNVVDVLSTRSGGVVLTENSGNLSIIGSEGTEGDYYNFYNNDLSYTELPEVSGNIISMYKNGYGAAILTDIGKAYAFGGSNDTPTAWFVYDSQYYQNGTNTNDISDINFDILTLYDEYVKFSLS